MMMKTPLNLPRCQKAWADQFTAPLESREQTSRYVIWDFHFSTRRLTLAVSLKRFFFLTE